MKGRETMEQYQVTGMSCAACSARVEKAVSSVEGVTSCSVSLLTNSMGVEGTADSSVIIKAVEDAGYGAKKKGVQTQSNSSDADLLKDRETPVLKKRLITSLCFLIPLMYLSMTDRRQAPSEPLHRLPHTSAGQRTALRMSALYLIRTVQLIL